MFTVNYRDPRPIYEQIKQGLKQMMLDGEIVPGGKLPSVRELAVGLAINPNTIQRAYRELEQEGLICSVPGKGSFATEDFSPAKAEKEALFQQMEELLVKLRQAGAGREEILSRMEKGGLNHD